MELKFRFHPRQRQIEIPGWVVVCRWKNRFVDELHLRDPGHNPTSNELLLERSIEKESESCSSELEQSRIEEAFMLLICCCWDLARWVICSYCASVCLSLSAEISNLVMRLVRHQRRCWSLEFYGSKTAESISEVRRAKILGHGLASTHLSRKQQDEVPVLREFPKFFDVYIRAIQGHTGGNLIALPVDGSRRYSIQMERTLVSWRMFI